MKELFWSVQWRWRNNNNSNNKSFMSKSHRVFVNNRLIEASINLNNAFGHCLYMHSCLVLNRVFEKRLHLFPKKLLSPSWGREYFFFFCGWGGRGVGWGGRGEVHSVSDARYSISVKDMFSSTTHVLMLSGVNCINHF